MAWTQALPRSLNDEETRALSVALDSLVTLISDLKDSGHLSKANARIGVRQIAKLNPVIRSLGVSEATLAKLVSVV
jgi:hypothetical protein